MPIQYSHSNYKKRSCSKLVHIMSVILLYSVQSMSTLRSIGSRSVVINALTYLKITLIHEFKRALKSLLINLE